MVCKWTLRKRLNMRAVRRPLLTKEDIFEGVIGKEGIWPRGGRESVRKRSHKERGREGEKKKTKIEK
jgi:hypothetical protein